MIIRVNDKNYKALPSFMTLVRYRCLTGVSFLTAAGDKSEEIKLLYEGIVGEKPFFFEFLTACENDSGFDSIFKEFYYNLFVKERPQAPKSGDDAKEFDELEVLCLSVSCGIPQSLLEVLNIFQLVSLISKCCDLKSGKVSGGEMSDEDRKQLYGITPEKEEEIRAFLQLTAEESEG